MERSGVVFLFAPLNISRCSDRLAAEAEAAELPHRVVLLFGAQFSASLTTGYKLCLTVPSSRLSL